VFFIWYLAFFAPAVTTFSALKVNSPSSSMVIKQKEYLVCRKKFDNYMANLALKAGAKLFLNSSFVDRCGCGAVIRDNINKVVPDRIPFLLTRLGCQYIHAFIHAHGIT